MTTPLHHRSSWIDSIGYLRAPDGQTYLAVFTISGTAILYQGIPSTLPGLIAAGRVKTKDGERLSNGAAYHRLINGKYASETVKDQDRVEELKRIMKAL